MVQYWRRLAVFSSFAVICRLLALLFEETRAHQSLRHDVRVAVGGRTAILEVALLVLPHLARDADAGAAVGHAGRELVDAGGFVVSGEAPGVVQPAFGIVRPDVVPVSLRQLLDRLLDDSVKSAEFVRNALGL